MLNQHDCNLHTVAERHQDAVLVWYSTGSCYTREEDDPQGDRPTTADSSDQLQLHMLTCAFFSNSYMVSKTRCRAERSLY